MAQPTTHDEYLEAFPTERHARLEALRATIRAAAPAAVETIGYGVPTFTLHGRNLVHYAGFARHDSFFPGSAALSDTLADEVAPWRTGRGTMQFPHGSELPLDLIRRIVELRVAEETARAKLKTRSRPSTG